MAGRDMGTAIFRAIADFAQVRREARETARSLNELDRAGNRRVSAPAADSNRVANAEKGREAGKAFALGFAKGVGKLSVGAPVVGGAGALALGGAAQALSLAASLTDLVGVGLAVPGVLGGMAVASGVLASSLGDVKAHLGDLEGPLKNMQASMSGEFWYWAEKPLRHMAQKLLPAAQDGLENIARAEGQVVAEGAKAAESAFGNGRLSRMLEFVKVGIDALKPAIAPVVNSFAQLAEFGASKIPALGTAVANIATKWAQWMDNGFKSGMLQQWFNDGIAALKDLWSIAKSAFGIVEALVKAAHLSGAQSSLSTLAAMFKRISDVMNAPVFQGALATIFKGASSGAESIMKAFGPIGDMFVRIQDPLARFLDLGGQIVGTVLEALANALGNPAFVDGLNTFLVGLLVGLQALAPQLPVITGAIGAFAAALAPFIAAVVPFLPEIVAGFLGWKAAMVGFAIADFVAFLGPMAAGIGAGATAAWGFAAALLANPITWIILAIVALVAALIWFFTQTDLGREIWGGFVNWLTEVINGFLNWWNTSFVPGIQTALAVVGAAISAFAAVWSAIWNVVWQAIVFIWNMIVSWIQQAVQNVMTVLMVLGTLGALAWEWFMGLVNSAMAAGQALFDFVASIPGTVIGFLGDLGGLLIGAGQSLIQGFIDGISGMIGAVGDAVGGVMDFVAGFFPHSPAKRGAFSGKGWTPYRGKAVMTGFADGILAGQAEGVAAANQATLNVSNAFDPQAGAAALLGGPPAAPGDVPWSGPGAPPVTPAGGPVQRNLNVTVVNPAPEAPSTSIQKTYSKIAYLGLDGGEAA